MTHHGIGIVVFPTSWRLGTVRRTQNKWVWAFGPLRLTYHKVI